MATFATADEAMAAAKGMQERITGAPDLAHDHGHVAIRVGCHFGAVVQEQQQSLEQERREERRERWATRREAKLLELGERSGIGAEQRRAILQIMLATRDQVDDLRQSAQSPEAINALRDRRRELRRQSEAQIQALLTPDQYEAYQGQFGDDDDDDAPKQGEASPPGPQR